MGKKNQNSLEGHVSGQANKPLTRPAHALPYSKVVEEVGCNPQDGLTHFEAAARHEEYGNNDLGEDAGVQPGKILLRQVANAMTLVSRATLLYDSIANSMIGSHSCYGC
jgi:Na+-exporting ATPase